MRQSHISVSQMAQASRLCLIKRVRARRSHYLILITMKLKPKTKEELLVEVLLRLADDRLIHGHRLSEWTGHGPELEEDLALANMALDMIGHAAALYGYAAEIEGKKDLLRLFS